ncbi:hypothetical protein CJ010_09755 [Azoarcus sp. DD4]|uniref:helix-turn-helix domain-containing protein n=1 Tax=Azoarcus sp. DD4 TaxID=2027405 RepID=UPI00112B9FFE|nr:helix-turn-helix domain-containing protein [Azoarcus sp. DD4]QDF96793.1 hypothetical protein CJ010_09755 [Azoarcus sp. DD4]
MKLKTYTGAQIREHRKRLGLNQTEFWGALQITQSGGCRYESGRDIPEPVQLLLNLALGAPKASSSILESLRDLLGHGRRAPPPPRSSY